MKKIVVLGFVSLALSTLLNSCLHKCENSYLVSQERALFPKEGTKMVFKLDNKFDTITYGYLNSNMVQAERGLSCNESLNEEIIQKLSHTDTSIMNLFNLSNLIYKSSQHEQHVFNFGAYGYDQTIQYTNRNFNDVRVYENPKKSCDSVSYYDKTLSYKYSRSAGLLELSICDSNKTKTLSRVF